MLEDEHDRIRRAPLSEDAPSQVDPSGTQPGPTDDTPMADGSLDHDPDDDGPKSRGSEAVERRVEKIISELKASGAVDVMSEREFEAKKVRFTFLLSRASHPPLSSRASSAFNAIPSL